MEAFVIVQKWVASWPTPVIISGMLYVSYIMVCTQIFLVKARRGRYSPSESAMALKIRDSSLVLYMAVQVGWTMLFVLLILTFAKVGNSGVVQAITLVVSLWPLVAFTDEKVRFM